jgi:hypothetical protein
MTRYTPLWEQSGSYAAGVDRRLIAALWPLASLVGCAVTAQTAPASMTLNVAPGAAAVPTQNSTGSTLCVSDATELVPIGGASAQPRIDLVICQPRGTDLDGGTNNDFVFTAIQGTPAASNPAVPATPAGAIALAQVAVAPGVVTLAQANITDVRPGQQLAVPVAVKASARYSGSGTSSATSGTLVPVTWSSSAFDDANAVSGTTWTCKYAGVYTFSFQVGVNSSTTNGQTNLAFYKNGAQILLGGSTAPTGFNEKPQVVVDRCAVGDTMTFQFSTTQTSLTLRGSETYLNIAYNHP